MTAGALTAVRWVENYHLFILGVLTLAVAHLGRGAPEPLGETAITGIVTSYIGLLTAFYADNGKNLPLWRDPSPAAYWLAPALIGIPLIARAVVAPVVEEPTTAFATVIAGEGNRVSSDTLRTYTLINL